MKEEKKANTQRSRTFGVVINPLLKDQVIDWRSLGIDDKKAKLKELGFPSKFDLEEALNTIEFKNVNDNKTGIEDFEGQFELGTDSDIPHYQLAIKTKSVCRKAPILEVFQQVFEAHININIQFDFENMKKYCSKDNDVFFEEYSGRIFKHQWKLNFIDRKPELKDVLENPYPWQKFFLEQILSKKPDGRTIDWLVDPVGNTGKSSFARVYVSQEPTDGILMKIDNLDRMELSLIKKIQMYRDRYSKDPRIIFFDFPRAVDQKKVASATALMEDAKSGHLETAFSGRHQELQISNVHVVVMSNTAPDLSGLSVDRWRIWRLGGTKYNNIMWPTYVKHEIQDYDSKDKLITWNIRLECINSAHSVPLKPYMQLGLSLDWFNQLSLSNRVGGDGIFGFSTQYTAKTTSTIPESPNSVRLLLKDYKEKHGLNYQSTASSVVKVLKNNK